MDPGPFFYIQSTNCLLLCVYFLPFDTFNPLFSAKPVRLTTSSQVGDRVLWLYCAGLHIAAGTGSAPCQCSASYTFGVFPCSYWIDNLGFLMRENLLLCSSYLPLGVPQRARYILVHQAIFLASLAGSQGHLHKGSLS